jgi:hypothetical protein
VVFILQEMLPIARHTLSSGEGALDGVRPEPESRVTRALEGIPGRKPEVFIIDDESFAMFSSTGKEPAVYLSGGLVEKLSLHELRAAIAHEIGHIRRSRRPAMVVIFILRVRQGGRVREATPDLKLESGDVLAVIGRGEALLEYGARIGPEVDDRELADVPGEILDVVITNKALAGTTLKEIAQALVDAHKRGVHVEIILDKSNRSKKYSAADFTFNMGIPTYIDAQHSIAHNKVMIIDKETVITGSFNFTKAAEKNIYKKEEADAMFKNQRIAGIPLQPIALPVCPLRKARPTVSVMITPTSFPDISRRRARSSSAPTWGLGGRRIQAIPNSLSILTT